LLKNPVVAAAATKPIKKPKVGEKMCCIPPTPPAKTGRPINPRRI